MLQVCSEVFAASFDGRFFSVIFRSGPATPLGQGPGHDLVLLRGIWLAGASAPVAMLQKCWWFRFGLEDAIEQAFMVGDRVFESRAPSVPLVRRPVLYDNGPIASPVPCTPDFTEALCVPAHLVRPRARLPRRGLTSTPRESSVRRVR